MKKSVNYRLQLARENSPVAPLDYNNNNTKILRRTPSPPLQQLPGCICHRKSQIIECEKCKMLCYGRVSEPCPQHPNVSGFIISRI